MKIGRRPANGASVISVLTALPLSAPRGRTSQAISASINWNSSASGAISARAASRSAGPNFGTAR